MAALLLGGPASRENGGCCDCSAQGLLAYGAGGSVVVVDVRSMQVLLLLPMPPPPSSPAAPYVTALSWLPNALPRSAMDYDLSAPQMQLAVGDRHGRIALWDVGSAQLAAWLLLDNSSSSSTKQQQQQQQGIQDVCWVRAHPAWLLAAIHGGGLLVLWDPSTKAPLWSYEAVGSEVLSCVRCDPLDPRHLLLLASKGLLLSLLVTGTTDADILLKSYYHSLPNPADESSPSAVAAGGEQRSSSTSSSRDGNAITSSSSSSSSSSTTAGCRCAFSSGARGIVYLVFPREIVVFDLHLGMPLCALNLPRSCARLLDLVADVAGDLLFFSHVDGKLSTWRRKDNSQVFVIAQIDTLMPSIGNSVPPPSVLAVAYCPIGMPHATSGWTPQVEKQRQLQEPHAVTLVSVTDDGRLWQWTMKYQPSHLIPVADDAANGSVALQLELTGQLHLLPSAVTTLAVSVPSLLATVSGGGNGAAAAVPLVALATQSGTLELVDPSANAVTSSFSIHNNSVVRGVRWLGNSRLVSFSYTEIKGKGGGFVNKLVLTCIRSGQSKSFRVLQKPERAPMRALRTSPSGRYMLILFREAPAEVWAMTKNPQMLRSLALPFTVMEWALPAAPKSQEASHLLSHRPSLAYRERPTIASTVAAANASPVAYDVSTDASVDETAESFAFALVNGSLGVFELRGRRVRDFKPKWPVASFVSSDVLVTAMAYRMPHVVMGDRVGHLRWWDVISGASSSFNTHRGGIRRIKFAPVSAYDSTRGRVAVLFNDNSFGVYDLDTQDPVANAISQPQLAGILVVELDWFPLRLERQDPLLLCLVGADSSFRMVEFQPKLRGSSKSSVASWQRLRPVPVYSPALLPAPQALALRMLLQVGVSPIWFASSASASKVPMENSGDLRQYLLETNLPSIGDPVVLEVLLKALEPYRRTGRLLDAQSIRTYTALSNQGCAARLAFAAAHYGDHSEALFWLQLPRALALLNSAAAELIEEKSAGSTLTQEDSERFSTKAVGGQARLSSTMAPFSATVRAVAEERISWHKKLSGEEANQKIVHEHIAAGDFEAAVTLLLATPPESPHFYVDALRAVSLAAAVSPGLHELAIKVVAANMVSTEESLCGTHLLCAVGRYKEACSQLQDAGRWEDACTLAASKLTGSELARVLERWADHVLQFEHNIWKALTLLVAAGALSQALLALNAQFPDVAPLFLLACHEAKAGSSNKVEVLDLPGNLPQHLQDVNAVCEFYTHYQHRVSRLCSGITF